MAANAPGLEYQTVSIAELEQRIKINVFPGVAPEIKASKMALPVPAPHSPRGHRPVEVH